jgi:hypothetical protein
MYFSAAASAITSEAILQSLGAVYFGITAHYGMEKQFYALKHLDPYPRGVTAHMMYAGALLWLIMFAFTLIACFVALVGLNEVITNARKMMSGIENSANAIGSSFQGNAWIPKRIQKFSSRMITNAREMMSGIENTANAIGLRFRGKVWIPKRIQKFISRKLQSSVAAPRKLTAAEIRQIESVGFATIIFVAFLAQWLFWAGFVGTAGERYVFTFLPGL